MQRRRPVMLAILDGWGWREDAADNAVKQARTPNFDRLWASCPNALLHTSGNDVGLPGGQMGNSEVGHLNIGAGRVVMQDLPRIADAIASGEIERQPALGNLIARLKATGGTCHLMGLISPGGVHSHQDQAVGLAKILAAAGVPTVMHVWTDGRDTPPQSAGDDVARLVAALAAVDPGRHRVRTLLRHGSRQALGARGQGLCRDGGRRRATVSECRRGRHRGLCREEIRRVHHSGGDRRLSRHARRRRRAVLQFPRRPRARNSRRHPRSGVHGICAAPRPSRSIARSA